MLTKGSETIAKKRAAVSPIPYVLSGPLVVVLIFIMIVPLVALLWYSFYKFDPLLIVRKTLTLENYIRFFSSAKYVRITVNTVFYSAIITVLTFILGFPLAYWLSRYVVRGREFYLGLVVLPIALNNAVVGFGWTALLGQSGMVNRAVMALHLTNGPIQLMYNMPAVVIVLTEILMPYMVLTLLGVISRIDPHLEEAAANLGAPFWVVILKVVLPLSLPGIFAGSIFVFLGAATAFVIPRIIGGGSIQMLGVVIYEQVQMVVNYPFASVASIVLTVVAFGFFLLTNRLLQSRYIESLRGRK